MRKESGLEFILITKMKIQWSVTPTFLRWCYPDQVLGSQRSL